MTDVTEQPLNLEDYAAMAEGESASLQRQMRDPFSLGRAYLVELSESEPTESENGFYQVRLSLSWLRPDGGVEEMGQTWETLPFLSEATQRRLGEAEANRYRGIFARNFHGLLRALDPANFSIYHRREKQGGKWVYFDADDNKMSKADRDARRDLVEAAVVGIAKAIYHGKVSLNGKRAWLVKIKGAKGDKVYANWFPEAPEDYPIADGAPEALPGESPPPVDYEMPF